MSSSESGVGSLDTRGRPTLGLVMIVRSEEETLARCLASVVGVVDEIVVVDTGSTDRTKLVAETFNDSVPRGVRIVDFTWVDDFSAARNFGLEHATTDWILQLDADEELVMDSGWRRRSGDVADTGNGAAVEENPTSEIFIDDFDLELDIDYGSISADLADLDALLERPTVWAYIINLYVAQDAQSIDTSIEVVQAMRLFRRRDDIRYTYPVHEQIIIPDPNRVAPASLSVVHFGPSLRGVQNKSKRNVPLLESAIEKEPENAYFHAALGNEYFVLAERNRALEAYEKAEALAPQDAVWLPVVRRNMASCLHHLGRSVEAVELLKKHQKRYPDFTDLHFLEAQIHFGVKKYDEALEAFERCLRMGDAPAYYCGWVGTGSHMAEEGLRRAKKAARKYG